MPTTRAVWGLVKYALEEYGQAHLGSSIDYGNDIEKAEENVLETIRAYVRLALEEDQAARSEEAATGQ